MSFPSPFFRWRPHPWHGLDVGPDVPRVVHAYIEITPFDLVKYELDKTTGYLRVDRPQRGSSYPPSLYGIIPRTYCGERLGALSPQAQRGDGDPLDICVLSERPITKSEVILNARVVGGFQMVDDEEADDKIVAILNNDLLWKDVDDITGVSEIVVERLRHYFATYKLNVDAGATSRVDVGKTYDREHAMKVIEASIADYEEMFGE
jgi:inorganic pyrophosphatase